MKHTNQIERIDPISVANLANTFILVDSDEHNGTYKMRLTDFIAIIEENADCILTFNFISEDGLNTFVDENGDRFLQEAA